MDIVFYGQRGCMPCHMLRMKMMADRMEFDYRDVRDPVNQAEMLDASGGRFLTPTLVIGDTVMQNPNLREVKEALDNLETAS